MRRAATLGLVDRLVPTGTARAEALALAAVIAANSPIGVRNAKRALRLGGGTDLAAGLGVFGRIGEQVRQHLRNAKRIGVDQATPIVVEVEHLLGA